jgi:hypothetical protein
MAAAKKKEKKPIMSGACSWRTTKILHYLDVYASTTNLLWFVARTGTSLWIKSDSNGDLGPMLQNILRP